MAAPQHEFTASYFVDRLEVELTGLTKSAVLGHGAVDAVIRSIEHHSRLATATPIVANSVGEKKFRIADAA